MRVSAATLLLSLLVCLAARAQDPDEHAASAQAASHTRSALLAAGDPDSLAAAAPLDFHSTPAEGLALVTRAVTAAPNRADLVWLQLAWCARVDGCDGAPIEARLHALDPGNAAAWSLTLAKSAKQNDTTGVQATLVRMAGSERFDSYWNSIVVHAANAMIGTGTMTSATAVVAAIGAAAALPTPYQPLVNGCRGKSLEVPGMLDTCRRLSAVLRRGDTYLTERVGLGIATHVWPDGSPEYRAATEARRVSAYQLETAGQLGGRRSASGDGLRGYLDRLASTRTEQQATMAELIAAGLSPQPSPDWTEPGP